MTNLHLRIFNRLILSLRTQFVGIHNYALINIYIYEHNIIVFLLKTTHCNILSSESGRRRN